MSTPDPSSTADPSSTPVPLSTPLLADLLRAAATEDADREAFVHGDKRATFGWLDRAADGFAATLLARGVTRGDVVVLMVPSSIKFAVCYLGAARVGAITSAINLRLGAAEQASIIARTDPAVTVLGDGATLPVPDCADRVDAPDPGHVISVTDLKDAFAADPPARLPNLDPTDPVCIIWTSATTGAPKGAIYTHETLAAISRNVVDMAARHDRLLHSVPFAHLAYMGWAYGFLEREVTIVLGPDPWSPTEALRLVREHEITMMNGVPTQWNLLMRHPDLAITDFSGLRIAAMGAAPATPDLIRSMRTTLGCPVLNGYASTEAGIISGTVIGDSDEVVAATVGRARGEVELRIVGADTTSPRTPPLPGGEVGEIVVRSPAVMRGYWRDPELTATVIDGDGWLHTGDLGVLDADANLTIVGRLKEMYIRGGYNVYPVEVESVLQDHPAIARAAVVGVPDPVLGEIGVAFVVLVPDPSAPPPDHDDVRRWCAARIADYKAPDHVVAIDEIPLTAMGKVDKQALQVRGADHVLTGGGGHR